MLLRLPSLRIRAEADGEETSPPVRSGPRRSVQAGTGASYAVRVAVGLAAIELSVVVGCAARHDAPDRALQVCGTVQFVATNRRCPVVAGAWNSVLRIELREDGAPEIVERVKLEASGGIVDGLIAEDGRLYVVTEESLIIMTHSLGRVRSLPLNHTGLRFGGKFDLALSHGLVAISEADLPGLMRGGRTVVCDLESGRILASFEDEDLPVFADSGEFLVTVAGECRHILVCRSVADWSVAGRVDVGRQICSLAYIPGSGSFAGGTSAGEVFEYRASERFVQRLAVSDRSVTAVVSAGRGVAWCIAGDSAGQLFVVDAAKKVHPLSRRGTLGSVTSLAVDLGQRQCIAGHRLAWVSFWDLPRRDDVAEAPRIAR